MVPSLLQKAQGMKEGRNCSASGLVIVLVGWMIDEALLARNDRVVCIV